jgi:hypothetical protein
MSDMNETYYFIDYTKTSILSLCTYMPYFANKLRNIRSFYSSEVMGGRIVRKFNRK